MTETKVIYTASCMESASCEETETEYPTLHEAVQACREFNQKAVRGKSSVLVEEWSGDGYREYEIAVDTYKDNEVIVVDGIEEASS